MTDTKTIIIPIIITCFVAAVIIYAIYKCLGKDENTPPGVIEPKDENYRGVIML